MGGGGAAGLAAFFVFGPWLVGPSVCCVQQRGTLSGSMGGYSVAGRAAAANKAKRGHEAMVWGGLAGLATFLFFVFFPGVWLVELLVRCMAPCMAPCVAPCVVRGWRKQSKTRS